MRLESATLQKSFSTNPEIVRDCSDEGVPHTAAHPRYISKPAHRGANAGLLS